MRPTFPDLLCERVIFLLYSWVPKVHPLAFFQLFVRYPPFKVVHLATPSSVFVSNKSVLVCPRASADVYEFRPERNEMPS